MQHRVQSRLMKWTHIFLCLSISTLRSSSSFLCFSSRAFLLLRVLPKMSMRSGGVAARSLRAVAVAERERERDSRRRFLLDSRDLDRFLDRSLSLDRERLRFLLCLLLLECLDLDELRLRERPMVPTSTSGSRALTPNHCVLWLICGQYLEFRSARNCSNLLLTITDQEEVLQRFCFGEIIIQNWLFFCPANSLKRKMAVCRVRSFPEDTAGFGNSRRHSGLPSQINTYSPQTWPLTFGKYWLYNVLGNMCFYWLSLEQSMTYVWLEKYIQNIYIYVLLLLNDTPIWALINILSRFSFQ